MSNSELLRKIETFYVNDQGSVDAASAPLSPRHVGNLLLEKACTLTCECLAAKERNHVLMTRSQVLASLLSKVPLEYGLDVESLFSAMQAQLSAQHLPFVSFKSILSLATQLYNEERMPQSALSGLVTPLVRHAWCFLSLSEPKFHVEAVRYLWHLQSVLSAQNRDVEAAIAAIIQKDDTRGTFAIRPADTGRSFGILWSHTLQDGADRRNHKSATGDVKKRPRLSGQDDYQVMLTRPLFLMLDSLIDERTQLFLAVKHWLNSMVGIDK
jgi:hypothetical protein